MQSIHTTMAFLADSAGGSSILGMDNVRNLILALAGILIMVVGLLVAAGAKKGRFKDAVDTGGGVMVAVIIIGLGATMAYVALGEELVAFLFNV